MVLGTDVDSLSNRQPEQSAREVVCQVTSEEFRANKKQIAVLGRIIPAVDFPAVGGPGDAESGSGGHHGGRDDVAVAECTGDGGAYRTQQQAVA